MEQGSLCFMRGHIDLGESITSDAIGFCEQVYGNIHPELAYQFHSLAIIYHQLAQPLSRRINTYEASAHATGVDKAKMRSDSGIEDDEKLELAKRELQAYLESAARMNRQSVIIAERTLGLDHPDTIQQYADLGILEHAIGNVELGLRLTKHALDLWEITFGPNYPDSLRHVVRLSIQDQT
jgi:protein TIF31